MGSRKRVAPGIDDINGWKYLDYTGPYGRVQEAAGTKDLREAKRLLAERKREVLYGTWKPRDERLDPTMTLATWAEIFLAERAKRKLATERSERQRIRDYILPVIGDMRLCAIRPKHVEDVIRFAEDKGLAPRTLHHVRHHLRVMLKSAAALEDSPIVGTPWVLPAHVMPPKEDKDPHWRAQAIYTRDEVEMLISDERVPEDRRLFYALMFLTGMRAGEVVGRRWRDIDFSAQPLARLTLATQKRDQRLKTRGVVRYIPVHPTLAAMLAEWRLHSFAVWHGRRPTDDDWIVPSRRGMMRLPQNTWDELQTDLSALGLRRRRQHDARRTFISLGLDQDANAYALGLITHRKPRSGDAFWDYPSLDWTTLCRAVEAIPIQRRKRGAVLPLKRHGSRSDL